MKNKNKVFITAFFTLAYFCGMPGKRGGKLYADSFKEKKLRVLFIGNSFTGYNNMPDMIRRLAEAAGEKTVFLPGQNTPGGYSLRKHWESGGFAESLASSKWDYVILQDESQRPSFPREQRTRDKFPYFWLMDDRIKAAGSRTILLMTWGFRNGDQVNLPGDTYMKMQERLRQGYIEIAAELNALIAPAGLAWEEALKARPGLDLWSDDGFHPGLRGSYLAACVIYSLLYGKSPLGNAYTAGLEKDEAEFLQNAAARAALVK